MIKRLVAVCVFGAACASSDNTVFAKFESLRGDTTAMLNFLRQMPKGGDLHNHLSGDIAPESTAKWAAEEGFCLDTATMTILGKPCAAGGTRVLASRLITDTALHRKAVAAWSMQDFVPGKGETGADHFFATFLKVGPVEAVRLGDMIAEVVSQAATDHVSYVELMLDPDNQRVAPIGAKVGWNPDLDVMRRRIDSAGLGDTIRKAARHLDTAEARAKEIMKCGTPNAAPGCNVTVRYVYYSIRAFPPEMAFAQLLAGFEWPGIDPRFVAVNMVAPEHGPTAVKDFALHMSMIDHLRNAFPKTNITLHAGELSESVTTRDVMRSHIRQSIDKGHAQRIGHGVDVMQEDSAEVLLKDLHDRDVLVEICLTSNSVILGVTGTKHPLRSYLDHGVPVALGTDDEGVSRSDMAHEYLRAVLDQHVDYATLVKMARNSLTHSFADVATKQKLLAQFDADIIAFEKKQ